MDVASILAGADAWRTRWRQRRSRVADPVLPSAASMRQTARRLFAYVHPHRLPIALAVVAFFAGAAIDPLLPALFKQLLDTGFKADAPMPVWAVPLVIIGLFVVRGGFNYAGSWLFASSTSHAVLALRQDLVRAAMGADASLYSQMSPGVIAARVINDPQNAISALVGAITTLLRDGTTLVALLAYLLYLDWRLTLVSLVSLPFLAWVVRRVQRRVLAISGRSWESQVRLIGIVDDIARAWRVVRTFDAGEFERRRFGAEAEELRHTTMRAVSAGAAMTPLTQVVTSIGVAFIVTWALVEARHGGGTVGDFVAFVTALLMTISPLRHLTDVAQPIIGGLVQARGCFGLIDTPPEPDRGTRILEPAEVHGALRFERVSVVYPGSERRALDDVTFDLPAGQTIALVGPSGSGKSTVVNALLGFVTPASGRVLFDGIDIEGIRKASLRRQCAVVSQDIVLFDGTIEDNIVYAQPMDPARVEACVQAADLTAMVQHLAEGLRTRIGTNGARLSGGQRQRLAIARALYKEASVWIFDEATSALDSESERVVHEAIERWGARKTLLLIAHRLSTVRNADRIVVLRDGRVVGAGRHEELLASNEMYAAMVRAQVVD